jgi:hypothetical protein
MASVQWVKMKSNGIFFSLLALMIVCLLNVLINTGCATKPTDDSSRLKLDGLDGAMGKYYDTPILY